jgi:hypothetical protein
VFRYIIQKRLRLSSATYVHKIEKIFRLLRDDLDGIEKRTNQTEQISPKSQSSEEGKRLQSQLENCLLGMDRPSSYQFGSPQHTAPARALIRSPLSTNSARRGRGNCDSAAIGTEPQEHSGL